MGGAGEKQTERKRVREYRKKERDWLRTAWTTAKLVLAVCWRATVDASCTGYKNVYIIIYIYVIYMYAQIRKIYMCSGRKLVDARK